ncbi:MULTISPECIES: AraD1 family protein [Acidobacteriaceae]|uniref:AraD1 family protein n=1 Tax=Acidobacteriaceae TaxID=204434 RepID=UPI001576108C|nr:MULTISPECIES: AraD1 family protein [Acidobacteriaceae]MDW5267671.1 AraD1 family protein [Edaphobacter sp.]
MIIHLVQIADSSSRRVALVEEPYLRCLTGISSVYELAQECLRASRSIAEDAVSRATGETLLYDDVYNGKSSWRLLAPIDVPGIPSRLLVAGTGLTHLGSAQQRQAMHLADQPKREEILTDSMRMFQWGVDAGRPPENQIGIAPEWFFKGDGSVVRAHLEPLEIPECAEDGGEEAEIAGIYIVAEDGTPYRIGMANGNEFSDHKFEKRNYLNLAGSKLRTCSLGPELVVGAEFGDIRGRVKIQRSGESLWQKSISTGEKNMCHSLANLEHHHFKFAGHRQPGSVHVHFFGADALSFADDIVLREGDITEVSFEGYGRPLRNSITEEVKSTHPVRVRSLA